ncbi:hypothetical protein JW930_07085 [Candidatus Woesearchaeota archaeon]|nr:hypothetical protein [Candidatus Woesearchaeota archaeon]
MLFLFSGILDFILVGIILFFVIKKKKSYLDTIFYVLSTFYGIVAFMNVLWHFRPALPLANDALILESLFLVGKTTVLLIIFSYLLAKRNILFYLFLYIISALALQFSFQKFFIIVNFISYSLLMLGFLFLLGLEDSELERSAIFGSLFSFFSVLFILLNNFGGLQLNIFFILNKILLIISIYYLLCYFSKKGLTTSKKKKKNPVLVYFSIIFFIVINLVLTFITVISLHELGHALAGQYYHCEYTKAVIYDAKSLPHTELRCSIPSSILVISFAGIVLPLFVGILLLLYGRSYVLGNAYLIIGFSFYLSKHDLSLLSLSQNMLIIVLITSFVFLFLGIKTILEYIYKEELS